jgi:hypothetical protein
MDLRIRPAQLDDAAFMVPLVNDADGGMPLAIWTSLAQPGESPWHVGLRRVRSDDTPVSWSMGWIAEDAGAPVGALIVHQLSETPEQLEATIMSPLWQLQSQLELFLDAYNHARRLKTLQGLTPAPFIWKEWQSKPDLFHGEPCHLMTGLNT